MRGFFYKRYLYIFSALLFVQLCFYSSRAQAYQIGLEYYDDLTLDTVTPKGIYKKVIIYLDASAAVLDKISAVTYHLEGDFYKPHLTVKSKNNAFQLDVNTLTHIPVSADVRFKDGKTAQLNNYILLGTRKKRRDPAYNIHLDHTITKTPEAVKKETEYELDLFVEGPQEDLEQLSYIEYHFSNPFPQRMVKVSSNVPKFKFQIKSDTQLDVQAYAYFKDGTVIELVRFLYFKYY